MIGRFLELFRVAREAAAEARAPAPPARARAPDLSPLAEARRRLHAGDRSRARALCQQHLQQHPGDDDALRLVEDMAFDEGEFTLAIAVLESALQQQPDSPGLLSRLGGALQGAGEFERAAEVLRRAVDLDPTLAKAHSNLGSCLQELGRFEQAAVCFERAIAADPDLWQPHNNLGILHRLRGRIDLAAPVFERAARLRRAVAATPPGTEGLYGHITLAKLEHDIEQLRYLDQQGLLEPRWQPAIKALEQAHIALEPALRGGGMADFPPDLQAEAAPIFNRLLHLHHAPRLAGPAINPGLDRAAIEAAYFGSGVGITHVDDVLTPEALASLRRFCLESTIWFDFHYRTGYLGTTLEDGFACPLLLQVGEELRAALPGIIGDQPLAHMWGYKYDSQRSGIAEHADFAAVNVNFWLAPDEANLRPGTGGLVVWDKEAPLDWDFEQYNNDQPGIRRFLQESGARQVVIPHRQNRAAIFNSDLFHRTDDYHFAGGYENRRLNITFLYGYRKGWPAPGQERDH